MGIIARQNELADRVFLLTRSYCARIFGDKNQSSADKPLFDVPFQMSVAIRDPIAAVWHDDYWLLVYSPYVMCGLVKDSSNAFIIIPIDITRNSENTINIIIEEENGRSAIVVDIEFQSDTNANILVSIGEKQWRIEVEGEEVC